MPTIRAFFTRSEYRAPRDFLLLGFGMMGLVVTAGALLHHAGAAFRNLDQRFAATSTALPAAVPAVRTSESTIVRSVLDDLVATGSVGGNRIVIDPCATPKR
jgi:hypothetical protein